MMRAVPILIAMTGAVLAAPGAVADGLPFVATAAAGEPVATNQRALLWQRTGRWEVHIQPQFDREATDAAWVVPFPVRPSVTAGSAELLDQLELLTAPLFVRQCRLPCCTSADCEAGTTGRDEAVVPEVTIWESGTVGDLDYVILSTGDGDSLAAWLDLEGYVIPPAGRGVVEGLDTEGLFFFVSRLAAGVDPARPIAPVVFELAGLELPTYPLRLTALGVPDGETLDLTLWVVFDEPGTAGFAAASHAYDLLPEGIVTPAEYHAALDAFFDAHDPGTFAFLFGAILSPPLDRTVCGEMGCSHVWASRDTEWLPEIVEMAASYSTLQRWYGRLSAAALARDFTMEPIESIYDLMDDHAFIEFTGYCYSCPPDDEDAGGETEDAAPSDTGVDVEDPDADLEPQAAGGGLACAVAPGPAWPSGLALLVPALILAGRRRRRG